MVTLKDKLSYLTYRKACKLLGPEADYLLSVGGGKYDIDIDAQVYLNSKSFALHINGTVATIDDITDSNDLHCYCSDCTIPCDHLGAAFSLILEEKTALGLAAPPPEKIATQNLSEAELVKRALSEREERASKEKMKLKPVDKDQLWTD